jgi:hypothetical protein
MEGEPRILQQRVEAIALHRRGVQALERVRGKQQKGIEAEADKGLPGQSRQHGPLGQAAFDRATKPPASPITVTHSSIEPSWFPHVPAIL